MRGLELFFEAFWELLSWATLFNASWAVLLGIVVGVLPGLTATMGVALLTTLTYKMDPHQAILTLICMYVGAIYGGSRTAILLNIPGTPASAATTLDGFPLAKAGRAGEAMGIATTSSAIGTLIGTLFLAALAPLLTRLALDFHSYEFFWLALFGVIISGQLTTGTTPLKGYIAGILGLLVAMIGMEGIHAHLRFTLGFHDLNGGIGLIPAMVGAFGFAEVLSVMYSRRVELVRSTVDRVVPRFQDIWRYKVTALRSGVIGTFIGIIPGVGEDIGAWASYAAARRASKTPEEFGKGSIDGLTAAETGDNAVVPGALIPTLTLAVPGSAASAVLIAALFIHGVRPGPMLMIEQPAYVYSIVAMLIFSTVGICVFGLMLTRPLLYVLRIPRERLMPIVFVLCVIGPYALTQRMFDVWVVLFFGVAGFLLKRIHYPMAPLVLGIILGDLLDKNLRRGLTLSDGDISPFFTRPISAVFCALIVLTILYSVPPVRNASVILSRRIWSMAQSSLPR
jgi:putative tricarboxylic transport membrane protein